MQTYAAVAYSGEDGFRYETIEVEDPRPGEIRVEIKGVGLCHTDLSTRAETLFPYPFPAVFGHEGAGVVEAVGEGVTKVAPGDHVVLSFRSCGACAPCDDHDPAYCDSLAPLNFIGRREDGSTAYSNDDGPVSSNFFGQSSFAGHAITYERNVVKVDKDLPIELLGPLGCGVQTGAGGVMRSLGAKPGSSILITGGGSVGLSAVMGAKLQDCATIILVEPMAERRALGEELGATHTIDPTKVDDLAAAVREIVPMGVNNALETSGIPAVQTSCMAALGNRGCFGIVGVAPQGTPAPGDANMIMGLGQTIKGIIEGDSDPDDFIPEMIAHYKAGRFPFDKLIKTFKLSEINEAIEDQHHGGCVKAVLLP